MLGKEQAASFKERDRTARFSKISAELGDVTKTLDVLPMNVGINEPELQQDDPAAIQKSRQRETLVTTPSDNHLVTTPLEHPSFNRSLTT